MGADRAYVVLDEIPARTYAWCADGVSYTPGWPSPALTASAKLPAFGPDVVAVADVRSLPPGERRDALLSAGVRGWACVSLIRPGRVRGILALDANRTPSAHAFPGRGLMQLAGDAVANALERDFLERDRAMLMTRLERARRMQMIGQLATGIAHNFNNIIGAILGYAEMAEAQVTPGSKPAQNIDEIRRATERGRDLIEDILAFGRPQEAQTGLVQVRRLLDEAASLLRGSLPATVELVIEHAPADVAVCGKAAQLQQVIINLCNNASQAMDGSGCVRVSATQVDVATPPRLTHGGLALGRYVCLAVADSGRGFDEAVARRLFEPFFTTRSTGTGLGLATVLEIVRDHEGAMNVQSELGLGSRFEAWLPAVVADGRAAPSASKGTALPLGSGETVLVIESERERLLRAEEMLAALWLRASWVRPFR